jgi:NADPH-dependent 2,4-dienoyl-CoA reductase/sulfur reductase-like enzyme
MSKDCDVVVIGAGPAGTAAALEIDRRGLRATLVEEGPEAGGQVYRPVPPGFSLTGARGSGPDYAAGSALRRGLSQSRVETLFGHTVWLVQPGFVTHAFAPAGSTSIRSKSIIVATGTYERVIPMPGWTLPGVIGLGAVTTLLKSQQALPGRRVVVAGCGPLLPLAAAGILKAGGTVVAVVDLNGPRDFLRASPRALLRPDLAARGIAWMGRILRSRVPVLWRHAVTEVAGSEQVEAVRVSAVDTEGRPKGDVRSFAADALAIGHGLVPATEITRLLGAAHEHRPARGGWVAALDSDLRTSIRGLYVAGDGAGIAGAAAAELRGRLAGLAAARDLGALQSFDEETRGLRRALRRAEGFGEGMSALMTMKSGLLDTVTADTVVCRCEDVTRREIDAALAQEAGDMNQLKAWTRCGMGPCQGRMCGDTVAGLMASRLGATAPVEPWTPRPPLRPVPVTAITGEYAYADVPLPPPAPA